MTTDHHQKRIEPLKAARRHATYIDSKVLSVTKYSFQIYFRFQRAMTQAQLHTAGMADILSAAFVFDEDLVCQLEIEDLSNTKGILLLQRMIGLA